jgi:P22_AR N-terminal domain
MDNVLVINKVKFECPVIENEIFVPIKPVCDALGIDHSSQIQTIKNHPRFGSVVVENPTTGSDGKQYSMLCLPLKYTLGWLMGIDERKVKEDAKDTVAEYQEAAYQALYEKFYLEPNLQKTKLLQILQQENKILNLINDKKEIADKIREEKKLLEQIKATDPTQLKIELN